MKRSIVIAALKGALVGIVPWSLFLLIFLSHLRAERTVIAIEAEAKLLDLLDDEEEEPEGLEVPDWLEEKDLASLHTILERTNFKIDELEELFNEHQDQQDEDESFDVLAWLLGTDEEPEPTDEGQDDEEQRSPVRHDEEEEEEEVSLLDDEEPDQDEEDEKLDDVVSRVENYIDATLAEYEQEASTQAMQVHEITRYVMTANQGACEECLADNGKVYDSKHAISHHPNCKCTAEPIVIEEQIEVTQ